MTATAFNSLLTDTVTVEPAAGSDQYGTPTFGAPVTYPARILYRTRSVRSNVADVALSKGVVWVYGNPPIGPDDRVTLPDGTNPDILMIEKPSGMGGIHHAKLTFGWGGSNVNPR